MNNFLINLVLSSPENNINECLQYYISLGFQYFYISTDSSDKVLHNNLQFYNKFVSVSINKNDKSAENKYVLELEIDDFLYISKNSNLLEVLNYYKKEYTMTVELPKEYLLKRQLASSDQQSFIENTFHRFYKKYGFLVVKKVFHKEKIQNVISQAQSIYKMQMISLGLIDCLDIDNDTFEKNMKILFNSHRGLFFNCAKHCQYIIDLWRLSLTEDVMKITKMLGVASPIISTRPILFSNSKHISKADIYHTVPPHQDWATMQGSINSIICWLPLIDTTQDLGCIAFVPESHKQGLLMEKKEAGFGLVKKYKDDDFVSIDLNQGDSLFFSSFLVHKSGNNITENIRWSTHFRYNDLDEKTFIENGYPHAYIYNSVDEILNPHFDTKKAVTDYFICE